MGVNISNCRLSLYALHQLITRYVYLNFYVNKFLFVFFVFISGLITFCSPCLFSVMPLILAYVGMNKDRNVYSFLFGLTITLIVLLTSLSVLGYNYHRLFINLPFFAALSLVILGLYLLNILAVNINMNSLQLMFSNHSNISIINFLVGCCLAISVIPCSAQL